jgi:hypothetical protein
MRLALRFRQVPEDLRGRPPTQERGVKGTRCSLPAFIRSAGIAYEPAARSISTQRMP